MANREDEWIQILRKNIRLFNGKGWSIRGIKSGKLKKLQITHRIDDGLQHENPRESILTSIEFIQENSPELEYYCVLIILLFSYNIRVLKIGL